MPFKKRKNDENDDDDQRENKNRYTNIKTGETFFYWVSRFESIVYLFVMLFVCFWAVCVYVLFEANYELVLILFFLRVSVASTFLLVIAV